MIQECLINHDHLFLLVDLALKPLIEVLLGLNEKEKVLKILLYINLYAYLVLLLHLEYLVDQEYLFEKKKQIQEFVKKDYKYVPTGPGIPFSPLSPGSVAPGGPISPIGPGLPGGPGWPG